METDGRRMCEVLVGLGEVDLVGVEELAGDRLRVTIRSRGPRPLCGGVWWEGVVQGRSAGAVGGLAGVRAAGAAAVAETPLGVPRCDVWCEVVRGTGPVGGAGTWLVDVSCWSLGNPSGGSYGAYGFGGGRRVGGVIGTR